jgi:hypothetical protein
MSLLNTGMNVLGTVSVLKSLTGRSAAGSGKLNNFISELKQNSVARTNLFDVVITPPKMMAGSKTASKISLFAEGAQLPGINIQTDDGIKRFGYGPQDNIPHSSQTNDITLNFIGDGKGEIYKFFYKWMQGIVRSDYEVPSNKTSPNGLSPYEVAFKEEYETTIAIKTYDEQGETVFEYQLTKAFPKNLPDVSLNWSDSGMMQFSVTFCFLQSRLVTADSDVKISKNGIEGLSTLQKAIKVGTAVQTIAALRRPRSIQDALASSTSIKNLF